MHTNNGASARSGVTRCPGSKSSTEGLTIETAAYILNHMVEQRAEHLDSIFHALADPTRRDMLRRLSLQERTVSELAAPFEMSLAAASKHVKVLEQAGLIRRTVRGRTHVCRLAPEALADAHEWLRFYERFWNERLDALERELRQPETNDPRGGNNE
jgi:DNA-binding transcriptional ArsR family regulator